MNIEEILGIEVKINKLNPKVQLKEKLVNFALHQNETWQYVCYSCEQYCVETTMEMFVKDVYRLQMNYVLCKL